MIRLILYTDQLVLRRNGVIGEAKGHVTPGEDGPGVGVDEGEGGDQGVITPNSAAVVEGSSQITVRGIDNTVPFYHALFCCDVKRRTRQISNVRWKMKGSLRA